jgi:hypothetical protein
MKRIVLIVILVLVACTFLSADVYVKNMKKTEAFEMMGKKVPENLRIEEQWLGKNRFAVFTEKLNIIADFEKEHVYFIIPKIKQYYRFSTNVDQAKLKELLPPKVYEIISSIQISGVKVNLNLEKKKVGNWDCNGSEFEMTIMIPQINLMPKIKVRMWTTREVPFDYKSYSEGMTEFFQRVFLGILNIDEGSRTELEKLAAVEGFQVYGEAIISIFGSEIREISQCLEVVEKPAPAGIYSVPADYTPGTLSLPQK